MTKSANDNQISTSAEIAKASKGSIVRVLNSARRKMQLTEDMKRFTEGQTIAFEKVVQHLTGNKSTEQLIMFLSGEGGTGKSEVIKLLQEYCRLHFGKQRGLFGPSVALAPTGPSANNINGRTWQSALGKAKHSKPVHGSAFLSVKGAQAVGANLRGTKLLILDEISLVSLDSLYEISERVKAALCSQESDGSIIAAIKEKPFGGLHILFCGDLYQLSCIGGQAVYVNKPDRNIYAIRGRQLWLQLNAYQELTENCRFMKTAIPIFQTFVSNARVGKVDEDLLLQMNTRCYSEKEARRLADPKALWIAPTNEEVRKLNREDFQRARTARKVHYRVSANHTPATSGISKPLSLARKKLYGLYDKNCMTHEDFYVGQMVVCNANLATQIGKSAIICFLLR
jgi:hypothetical protein